MVGRDGRAVITTAGIAAISVTAAIAMYRLHQRERRKTWLYRVGLQRIPSNMAAVFRLNDVDRENEGSIGGAGSQRCSDTGVDIPIEDLVDVPGLVVYSIELVEGETLIVFMQVPSIPELLKCPFLDRGVRAVAEIGSKVYVARMDAVEKIPGLTPLDKLSPSDQSRISVVWSNGRCGSTLMHRMLQNLGVLSFSEPYWQDRLLQLKVKGFDEGVIARAFGICGAMDMKLASKSLPSCSSAAGLPSTVGRAHVSFNIKGRCFGYMEPVIRSLPHCRHLFMYRDVREVVESFCSIYAGPTSAYGKIVEWISSSLKKPEPILPPCEKPLVFSKVMEKVRISGAIPDFTKKDVNMITWNWLQIMCIWLEIKGDRVASEAGNMVSLRMCDYVRKDPRLIEDILRFVLGENIEVSEDTIALALEAFKKHSQEGDKMAASSFNPKSGKRRTLTAKDIEEIEAFVRAVPLVVSPDMLIPGSLGANVASSEA